MVFDVSFWDFFGEAKKALGGGVDQCAMRRSTKKYKKSAMVPKGEEKCIKI